jgi:mannose-6-phosphate isomerase
LAATKFNDSLLYDPPIEEFSVLLHHLEHNCSRKVPGLNGPSILISVNGSGEVKCKGESLNVSEGTVWFVSANCDLEIQNVDGQVLTIYQAFCSLNDL